MSAGTESRAMQPEPKTDAKSSLVKKLPEAAAGDRSAELSHEPSCQPPYVNLGGALARALVASASELGKGW